MKPLILAVIVCVFSICASAQGLGRDVRSYGAVCDGSTDDSSAFASAAVSANTTMQLPQGAICVVNSAIVVLAGQTWMLNGGTIKRTSGASAIFTAATDNWSFVGPGTLQGRTIATAAAEYGIQTFDAHGWQINNIRFTGFGTTGLDVVSSSASNRRTGQITGCGFDLNVLGISFSQRAEYTEVTTTRFDANTWGVKDIGGNTHFTNCIATGNTTGGLDLASGSNDSHGTWVGGALNHNASYSVRATQITLGFQFVGVNFYATGTTDNLIYIDRSEGLRFTGCTIATPVQATGTLTGLNVFQGCMMQSTTSPAAARVIAPIPQRRWLKFYNCQDMSTGLPWAYNDPSPIPSMTTAQINALTSPSGMILNSTTGKLWVWTGSVFEAITSASAGVPNTFLLDDTFQDTNGVTLANHPADVGGYGWSTPVGSATIQSNTAKPVAAYVIRDVGSADGTFTLVFNPNNGQQGWGPMFRWASTLSFYGIAVNSAHYAIINAAGTHLADGVLPVDMNASHTLVVTLSGATISATIDAGDPISYGSATINQTATILGFSGATNWAYSEVKFTNP